MRGLAYFTVFVFIIYCLISLFMINAVFIDDCGIDIMLTKDKTSDVDWLSYFNQTKCSYARVSTINVRIEWTEIEKLKENGWELINMNTNNVTREYIFQKVEIEKEITQVSG